MTGEPRAVLDTNVFISVLISLKGLPLPFSEPSDHNSFRLYRAYGGCALCNGSSNGRSSRADCPESISATRPCAQAPFLCTLEMYMEFPHGYT
jgi:hypothetical protein